MCPIHVAASVGVPSCAEAEDSTIAAGVHGMAFAVGLGDGVTGARVMVWSFEKPNATSATKTTSAAASVISRASIGRRRVARMALRVMTLTCSVAGGTTPSLKVEDS